MSALTPLRRAADTRPMTAEELPETLQPAPTIEIAVREFNDALAVLGVALRHLCRVIALTQRDLAPPGAPMSRPSHGRLANNPPQVLRKTYHPLREWRKAQRMTQVQLAATIGGGVTNVRLSNCETARLFPTPGLLARLVEISGIQPDEFWTYYQRNRPRNYPLAPVGGAAANGLDADMTTAHRAVQ